MVVSGKQVHAVICYDACSSAIGSARRNYDIFSTVKCTFFKTMIVFGQMPALTK